MQTSKQVVGNPSATSSVFPKPPPWALDSVEAVEELEPPPLPATTYTAFGVPYFPDDVETLSQPLDSDTRLYQEGEPLKEVAQRLVAELGENILQLIALLSKMGHVNTEPPSGTVKRIGKIYRNLQHILLDLRVFEAKDSVVEALESQLKKREDLLKEVDFLLGDFNWFEDEKEPEQMNEG